jgi:hypothetical protein
MMYSTLNHKSNFKLPPDLVIKSVDQTAEYLLARIEEATREISSFVQWDGKVIPW